MKIEKMQLIKIKFISKVNLAWVKMVSFRNLDVCLSK